MRNLIPFLVLAQRANLKLLREHGPAAESVLFGIAGFLEDKPVGKNFESCHRDWIPKENGSGGCRTHSGIYHFSLASRPAPRPVHLLGDGRVNDILANVRIANRQGVKRVRYTSAHLDRITVLARECGCGSQMLRGKSIGECHIKRHVAASEA